LRVHWIDRSIIKILLLIKALVHVRVLIRALIPVLSRLLILIPSLLILKILLSWRSKTVIKVIICRMRKRGNFSSISTHRLRSLNCVIVRISVEQIWIMTWHNWTVICPLVEDRLLEY
jgi:hypothetical protein